MKQFILVFLNKNYFLKDKFLWFYYFRQGVKYKINGHFNIIKIASENGLPIIKNTVFDVSGDKNTVVIQEGAYINNLKINIKGSRHQLMIGKNTRIESGCFWFNEEEGKIVISSRTTIRQAEIGIAESKTSVYLGEDCMLADGIDIRTGDSHSIINLSDEKCINPGKDIYIDNHVWIAKYVQILKGVFIGKDSIIGIRSVVTKDIPANSLAVGVPAKVSKSGITWCR
ncbi:MAG: acyltransferase [Microcoleaceae cyanobacterium]